MKNAAQPSSASARAVARQTGTYDTSVLVARTTRIRSETGRMAMAGLLVGLFSAETGRARVTERMVHVRAGVSFSSRYSAPGASVVSSMSQAMEYREAILELADDRRHSVASSRAFIDERKSQRVCGAGAGGRARHGRQRDPPGRSPRSRPNRSIRIDRGGLARRAARPRHLFDRRHSSRDRRRRARRARGLPPHHRRLRRRAGARRRDQRGPRGAQRRRCSSIASSGGPASPSRSSTRPKRAGWSTWPSGRRSARTRRFAARGRCWSRSAAAARA